MFNADVASLVAVNPDLAGGVAVQDGTIVKIPPYSPTCAAPRLVDAPSSSDSSSGTSGNTTSTTGTISTISNSTGDVVAMTPPGPGAFVAGNASLGDPLASTNTSTTNITNQASGIPVQVVSVDPVQPNGSASDSGGAGLGTGNINNSEDTPIITNIVYDGGNSNDPPPPQENGSTGKFVMGGMIVVGLIFLIVLIGLAFSGTSPMMGSNKKFRQQQQQEEAVDAALARV